MANPNRSREVTHVARISYCRKHASTPFSSPVTTEAADCERICTSTGIDYARPSQHVSDGLIHRYYDPTTGQFLSVDPAVATTGQPYAYVTGDPEPAWDPRRLCPCSRHEAVRPGTWRRHRRPRLRRSSCRQRAPCLGREDRGHPEEGQGQRGASQAPDFQRLCELVKWRTGSEGAHLTLQALLVLEPHLDRRHRRGAHVVRVASPRTQRDQDRRARRSART